MRCCADLEFRGRRITLLFENGVLRRVILGGADFEGIPRAPGGLLTPFRREFEAYFEGHRDYPDCPYLLEGSPFFRRCLEILRKIPRGEVRTYGWLAAEAGRPGAARAVGRILAANPLPLLFPCHRIVGKKNLGGFSAGRDWKEFLLDHEKALPFRGSSDTSVVFLTQKRERRAP
ncbi:methylated-DNA--[protein]-cysteine S-methyltransferase [Thermosulfurimonas sp. F29]|uniref:methylated-DNA--[protein]-cysteine S-methyltransferase n=1 Tax=Thermosulfurimonas sp. F29 TaxID=2867247 RepID=UPI001C83F727|nr:methylated-DNA--[protein]-cysteine S-methyltransferase [Thermosulfurimonas sp. F29]MBX6423611.1 methylated-DNA--[protein]-cysteine S-methyltransferase [Thermosulfurimonas sp. F29]